MKRRIIPCILFLIYGVMIMAQPTISQYISKGDDAVDEGKHQVAMHFYNEAIKKDESNVNLLYKYAEAARHSYAYSEAEGAYGQVLELDRDNNYPDASCYLGNLKYQTGNYSEAIRYFDLYLSENQNDNPRLTTLAQKGHENATWAGQQNGSDYPSVDIEHLDGSVNSPYSEHGAQVFNDRLFFSSLKFENDKSIFSKTRFISKILVADEAGVEVADNSRSFNDKDHLTSSTSFSKDGKLMAYSICDYDRNEEIKCQLYYSQINGRGEILSESIMPEVINKLGSTATQPAFGPSINGKTLLYFVSDRVGGKGGMDIWYTTISDNLNFTSPINVKTINTVGNELTPFYDGIDEVLYFSSDSRLSMGGFDVYQATGNFPEPIDIANVGPNVNSSYNDIYFSKVGDVGYLSSNRPGSQFLEAKFETCCYDIYKANFETCTLDLMALILDQDTGAGIAGATVTINRSSNPEPIIIENLDADQYKFPVDCDEKITISVAKDGYQPSEVTLDMSDIDVGTLDGPFEQKIYLSKRASQLTVLTFERATKNALAGVTVSLLDGNNERQTIDIQDNEVGNNFYFQVLPNQSYKILATKNGYEQEIATFVTDDTPGNIEKKIYMGRLANIATLAGLIPVRLYFDNDEPDKSTTSTTTDKIYSYTYHQYYQRKSEFKKVYGEYYDLEHAHLADDLIDNFFDNEVKKGHEQLSIFLETLVRVLESGKRVNLYMRGYTSPLSQDDYNIALGKRRVASIKNEYRRYNNGILLPYINSGQLLLTERSFGETTSPTHVSDDPNAPSKSIYSPSASRERRIEIDEIAEINN